MTQALDLDLDSMTSDVPRELHELDLVLEPGIDFELDTPGPDRGHETDGTGDVTAPMPLELVQGPRISFEYGRVLVVEADPETRLYWRAKLSVAGHPLVDEAVNAGQALRLLAGNSYFLAVLDLKSAGRERWRLLAQLALAVGSSGRGPRVLVTGSGWSWLNRWRVRRGHGFVVDKPLSPVAIRLFLNQLIADPPAKAQSRDTG